MDSEELLYRKLGEQIGKISKVVSMEVVMDIETISAPQEDIDHFLELFPSKKKKMASPGLHPCTSRILVIGFKPVGKDPVIYIGDERQVLLDAKTFLENSNPTRIITFNGVGFDIPMIRWRAAKNGIPGFGNLLPSSRSPRNYDIYQKIRWEMPMSLGEASMLITDNIKKTVGSAVEEMYSAGRIDDILEYNKRDLEITEILYVNRKDLLGLD